MLEFPIEMAGHLYNRAGATAQPVMCVERPVQLQSTEIIKSTKVYTKQQSEQKHENIPH